MNIKKILASVAASVVTVGAMATVASAVDITSDFDVAKLAFIEGGIYKINLQGMDGIDYMQVAGAKVVVEFELPTEEDYGGGSVVFGSDAAGWNQTDFGNEANPVTSGEAFTVQLDACPFAESDSYAMLFFQNFGTVDYTIKSVDILDASGNVLKTLDASNKPTAKAEETPDSTPDNTSKPNTDTGVAGIATVVGVAVVAAGAMVVSKKRK